MLSFGHAVYTGLGSFIAIHAMNMATKGSAVFRWCSFHWWAAWLGRSLPSCWAL